MRACNFSLRFLLDCFPIFSTSPRTHIQNKRKIENSILSPLIYIYIYIYILLKISSTLFFHFVSPKIVQALHVLDSSQKSTHLFTNIILYYRYNTLSTSCSLIYHEPSLGTKVLRIMSSLTTLFAENNY